MYRSEMVVASIFSASIGVRLYGLGREVWQYLWQIDRTNPTPNGESNLRHECLRRVQWNRAAGIEHSAISFVGLILTSAESWS